MLIINDLFFFLSCLSTIRRNKFHLGFFNETALVFIFSLPSFRLHAFIYRHFDTDSKHINVYEHRHSEGSRLTMMST